jgi:hypothetical protein
LRCPIARNTQAGQRSISRCFIDAEWQTYLPFFIQPPVIYLEVWTDDWQYGQTTPSHMQARRMQIGPCSRSYGFVDGNGQWREGNNLNEQVILDFLQAAGVDPNDPSLLPTAKTTPSAAETNFRAAFRLEPFAFRQERQVPHLDPR